MHVPAQRAGNFFSRGTGFPTAVRKNQPLVPRSNLGGKVCARTNPWFRGQTLLVLGHGGGVHGFGVWFLHIFLVFVCFRSQLVPHVQDTLPVLLHFRDRPQRNQNLSATLLEQAYPTKFILYPGVFLLLELKCSG